MLNEELKVKLRKTFEKELKELILLYNFYFSIAKF